MKFRNGHWLYKEGYACFSPRQVYEITREDGALELCAPTSLITGRGDTLEGINLTIRVTAPMPDVIRIQTWHHLGAVRKGPEFVPGENLKKIASAGNFAIGAACADEGEITVMSGSLRLVIDKKNWGMKFYRNEKLLTKSMNGDLAYIKTNWRGDYAYDRGPADTAYMREQLGLSVDEQIYGLGERFGPFVKNGQSVEIWNADGGTSTEQAYKNIPFYLSSKGYGVFVNHPEKVEFEVATEQVSKVGFSVRGEYLDYFLIGGESMKDVLSKYTDITGKPGLPPHWSFGLWLSTSFTTDYDEQTVMHFIDGMRERGIPLSVFHFDCCWMREFHWTDFTWDSRVFPNPAGMLKRIHERGVRVCVWINPYIGQASKLFREGMDKGYFIKRADGSVWQWDMWQPGMAIIDFTNPEAKKWYQDGLRSLLSMGVDCFKTDFGERIPTEDVVYFDSSDPEKMHNFYTYLYNEAVYEVLQEVRGADEACLFARSATAGGQKFPVHWGGDCFSDYVSMEQSLRGGLSLTSSGFGFWSHDIGGFESTSTPDVYKRWAAFGLLSTHSRLHGSSSYRVPWNYDEEAVDVVRFFTKLKLSLVPYLYSGAVRTSKTGIPLMRSMVIEFPEDPNCRYLDKQYFLGDSLLAAPVFNEEGTAHYYLPAGTWTNGLTGEVRRITDGKWFTEHCDYLSIPLWVRENSLIPTLPGAELADEDYRDRLEVRVYELKEKAAAEIFASKESKCTVTLCREAGGITGSIEGDDIIGAVRIRFVNCRLEQAVGAELHHDGEDTVLAVYGRGQFRGLSE